MPFDIAGARKAGYSEAEIIDHLAGANKFDLAGARKAGYSDAELLDHLTKLPSAAEAQSKALVDQIPATKRADGTMPPPVVPPAQQADPTLVDKLIGGGETALTLVTGATTGAAGMLAGGAAGIVNNLTNGKYGIPGGFEAGAQQGAESLTYAPRTEVGQEYAGAVGKVLAGALPMVPLTAEMGALGRGMGAAAGAARDVSAAGVQRIRTAVPAIADRVERTLRRNPDPATPTPGTRASGGSAGADVADLRRANAESLPVPIKLTQGQATRTFEQQRFEREMAKDPTNGEPLRNRYAQQNEDIMKNFDAWVDQTGAEAPNLRAVGAAVDTVLVKKAARDKAEIRVAYKNAEKAGEMQDPVNLSALIDYLNESAPDAATAPLLTTARARALQLGIAAEKDGVLVPANGVPPAGPRPYGWPKEAPADVALGVTLKAAERFRQAIGRATDYEATNIRQSTIIKGLVDTATEGAGGAAYRTARRMRENYAKQYEDRAVIASLLNKKRGMADRKVALEDVWDHSILKGSLDDVRTVRKVLQTGGEEGQQAWRELQGQTMNWIKDEATKNVATDTRGNAIVSADKLNKAIRSIDADGKMDFIFGKKGAEQLRDLNDLVKLVHTAPPGSVNTSNTASVLLAALTEAGVTGSMTGLPVPVLSALRVVAVKVKDRRIQKRIEQALNHRPAAPQPPARPPGSTLH